MSSSYFSDLLDILVENASRILRANYGVDRAEVTMFEIVDLLKREEQVKSYFLLKVENTFKHRDPSGLIEGMVPRELTELVAHELQWPELRNLASDRLERFFHGDRAMASGDPVHSVIEAYSDDWPDREFYSRYSK